MRSKKNIPIRKRKVAPFCDQTDIEGNGCNMTKGKKLKQQALLKLKKIAMLTLQQKIKLHNLDDSIL